MSGETVDLKAKGLYTHPNPLDVPQGALLIGNNLVIDRENTNEIRRGFKLYGDALTLSTNERPNKLFNYQDRLLIHYNNKLAYDSDNAGTWTDLSGTYDPPSGAQRIRAMESNKNFYFTTDEGIKKMDSYSATPAAAGMPRGLDGEAAVTGSSGFMATANQVAYRILWGKTDANDNKIVGAPSQRIIVANTSGGDRDVDVTFTIPATITTDHFYQIYRSAQSGGATTEPNDELQLIVEKSPTSGEITAKSVTYTDSTPDNLRGTSLYTNPNQETIAQANNQPPLAKDIAYFKDSAFYANVISKHRMYITLIAVGGSVGLVNDDTITIAGTTYTGKGTEDAASAEFLIETGGTASQNIEATAISLVKVINQYASNTSVYAYYLSGFNDLPGQILIEERSLGGAAFVSTSDRGGAFSPTIPSSGTDYSSSNETHPNGLYISKSGQSEAVPIANIVYVGSAQQPIRRIIALRDSLFVLKDDGVFRVTGETFSDFRISGFDSTTVIKGEETAVAFNNQVFCLSDQGVVAISDSGVQIMSRPIEFTLVQLLSSQYTNVLSASWAFSYESERKYGLAIVTETDDDYATQLFVYNSLTNTWTRWIKDVSCGIVSDRDGKLYFGSADPDIKYALQERKEYNLKDYAEREVAVSITAFDNDNLTIDVSDTSSLEVGWTIAQFNGNVPIRQAVIQSIDSATRITVDAAEQWQFAAATVYEPIPVSIQWAPVHGGNPTMLKYFREHSIIFKNAAFDEFTFSYTSDLSISDESVALEPKSAGPWGLFTWPPVTSTFPWGGLNTSLQKIPTYVPKEKAMCNWLNVSASLTQALKQFSIVGMGFVFEPISHRMK